MKKYEKWLKDNHLDNEIVEFGERYVETGKFPDYLELFGRKMREAKGNNINHE